MPRKAATAEDSTVVPRRSARIRDIPKPAEPAPATIKKATKPRTKKTKETDANGDAEHTTDAEPDVKEKSKASARGKKRKAVEKDADAAAEPAANGADDGEAALPPAKKVSFLDSSILHRGHKTT